MLRKLEKLKNLIAALLGTSLLISCSRTIGCESFHQIRDLEPHQKVWMKLQSEEHLPRGWLQDIADFRDSYKANCQ